MRTSPLRKSHPRLWHTGRLNKWHGRASQATREQFSRIALLQVPASDKLVRNDVTIGRRKAWALAEQDLLLSRLNDIGASLARSKKAVALIGLGSVGIEVDRLDEFSDLDFFAIVEPGYKAEFIEDLDWLGSICSDRLFLSEHTGRSQALISGWRFL